MDVQLDLGERNGGRFLSVSCTAAERTERLAMNAPRGGKGNGKVPGAAPPSRGRTRSQSARSAEDLMFFPKLRRRAKWVFALLAVAFGVGFVAFGVGTGVSGTSIGDVLQDIIGQQSAGGDIGDAQKKAQENPRDAAAQLAFANALQQAGRTREAIAALERYTALAPKDTDALLQLANLWGVVANRAENEAQAARVQAAEASGAQTFAQPNSPFLQDAEQNKIAQTLAAEANARADAASSEAQQAAGKQQEVYETLTISSPTTRASSSHSVSPRRTPGTTQARSTPSSNSSSSPPTIRMRRR